MISNIPQEDNLIITDNYYNFIKQISEDYLKYIINYKIATSEYLKKITTNHEKYNPKLSELKDKTNLKKEHLTKLVSIIPKVIEQQMINIENFVQSIDEKISKFELILKEKNTQYMECQNSFKESKNDIIKRYGDTDKLKKNFMTNITSVEEIIYKLYSKKDKKKKNNFKLNISVFNTLDNNNNVSSFEEQVNSSIQKTKKIEQEYKTNFKLLQLAEKNFLEIAEKTKERTRRILCEIVNGLKVNITEYLIYLKNCFSVPLKDIDLYFKSIMPLDELTKFDEIIQSSYSKNNYPTSINPEKYTLKIFRTNNGLNKINSNNSNISNSSLNNSINSNNSSNSINIEDELEFSQEEEIFKTIKKMTENFDLLEFNNYDLSVEEEKLRCKYLSLKILSFPSSNQINSNQIPSITDQEVDEIDNKLQKKQNRVIFLQKLSQFRSGGNFEIPEKEYNILSRLFNTIAKIIEIEKDYDSAVNIIILSQTYYITRNNERNYLQNVLMNNKMFKTKKFWESLVKFSIDKEIAISKKNDECNGTIGEDRKEVESNYVNIVFTQLLPLIHNMIEFGIDTDIVEEIISPIIKQYKISSEFSDVIYSEINSKKLEIQNYNNIQKNDGINLNQINEK